MREEELEITICDPEDSRQRISLFFRMLDTPIACRYLEAMRECAAKKFEIINPDRFSNFPSARKDAAWIASEINRCIDGINQHHPGALPHRAALEMSQNFLNLLHSYFERLRGGVIAPGSFYQSSPVHVRRAIDDLNLLIHRFEDFRRNQIRVAEGLRPFAQAVLTFGAPMPRYPLQDEDYQHFNQQVIFGSLYINYCELGKPLWDVFKDQDELVGDNNIRPLRYYSADTFLNFAPSHDEDDLLVQEEECLQFHRWWQEREAMLTELGFTWNDPTNSVGNITVANLNRDRGVVATLSEDEIVTLIGRHQFFGGIKIS